MNDSKNKNEEKLTERNLKAMRFKDLKDLAKEHGIKLPLGSPKEAIIDALLGDTKAKPVSNLRPWRTDKSLKRDPDTAKYYRMLKLARMPEVNVYEMMLQRQCTQATIERVFGKGPPPMLEIKGEETPPPMKRATTEDFVPSQHKSHKIDTKSLNASVWKKLIVAKKSEAGTGGVIFARLPEGVVVIKSGNTLAEELYGTWIAEAIGVRTPEARLVDHDNGEYNALQNALKGTVSLRTKISMSRILQRLEIAVMEFINGKPLVVLKKIPPVDALRQVGGIMALDVVLNNFDRLPFIWDNKGNAENIFYSDGKMVAIDNRIVCPTSKSAREKHLERVEALCKGMDSKGGNAEEWAKLEKFWNTRTMMNALEKKHLQEITKGFIDTAKIISKELTPEKLDAMLKKLEKLTWGTFWAHQVSGLDTKFINSIVAILKKHFG
mmetsp:Transcript_8675/g.12944  ORF Transcript_8675/g.12944 Transcript_8675/m.12944 type:complete len:437 (-) Transcript_8675:111-1421(-)